MVERALDVVVFLERHGDVSAVIVHE
jgi:hypothetical protein